MQVQAANVLFVDNPVGTGYSYCDTDDAFTTNVDGIAKDLVTLFTAFLNDLPVFQVSLSPSRCTYHTGSLPTLQTAESIVFVYTCT